jgi:hypothetical protein
MAFFKSSLCFRGCKRTFFSFTNLNSQFFLDKAMIFNGCVGKFNASTISSSCISSHWPSTMLISNSLPATINSKVARCKIAHFRVDDQLAVNFSYTNFRDRAIERNIRNSQCCRCCQTGKAIRHNIFISRYQGDHHLGISVVIFRE